MMYNTNRQKTTEKKKKQRCGELLKRRRRNYGEKTKCVSKSFHNKSLALC